MPTEPNAFSVPRQISVQEPTERLLYLDGLRGIAVLFIVLDSIFRSTLVFSPYTRWKGTLRDLLNWVSNGRASLAFFVVLSGFLLMRSVLAFGGFRGGVAGYFQRRAARLLPAYYAAFLGALLLIRLLPPLRSPDLSVEWQFAVPLGGLKMILSHFLLVHNLNFRWAFQADPPIWTIGTLAQLYLLFPLLALPVLLFPPRPAMAMTRVVAIALVLGLGLFLWKQKGHSAAPWFLSLFTFGMAAALRQQNRSSHPHDGRVFGTLAALLFLGYAGTTLAFSLGGLRFLTSRGYGWEFITPREHCLFDTWFALTTACFLISASPSSRHRILRGLSTKALVNIGAISYSLYLIYDPLIAAMKIPLDHARLGPFEQFAAYLVIGIPIVLLAAYVFHLCFERPFTRSAAAALKD